MSKKIANARPIAVVITTLLTLGMLAGCGESPAEPPGGEASAAPSDRLEDASPTEAPEQTDAADPTEQPRPEPTPVDNVGGVDVWQFNDVIAPDALLDDSAWTRVTFGDYSVAVPAEWQVFPAGASAEVDEVFSGIYGDQLVAIATGGAVEDLDSIVERNADGFLLVKTFGYTANELDILNTSGQDPATRLAPGLDQLLAKEGIESYLSFDAHATNRGLLQREVVFVEGEDGQGYELFVIGDNNEVVDTVVASLEYDPQP